MEDSIPKGEEFISFLERLAAGAGTREEWEHLVVAHYTEEPLELARQNLVRASIAGGLWSWPHVPASLRQAAADLRSGLGSQTA